MGVAEGVGLGVLVGVAVGVALADGEGLGVGLLDGDGAWLGGGDGVADGAAVGVADVVAVLVATGVGLCDGVAAATGAPGGSAAAIITPVTIATMPPMTPAGSSNSNQEPGGCAPDTGPLPATGTPSPGKTGLARATSRSAPGSRPPPPREKSMRGNPGKLNQTNIKRQGN